MDKSFLFSIMKGEPISSHYDELLEQFQINLDSGMAYFAIVIEIVNSKGSWDITKVNLNIQKLIEKRDVTFSVFQESGSKMVLLGWTPPPLSSDSRLVPDELLQQITEYKRKMENKGTVKINIGISKLGHSIESMSAAILEANYVLVHGIIFDGRAANRNEKGSIVTKCLPIHTELELFKFLKSGQFEKIEETIHTVVQTYEQGGEWSAYEGENLKYELIAILVKYFEYEGRPDEFANAASRLSNLRSLNDIIEAYRELCSQIQHRNQKRLDSSKDLNQEVLAFIGNHYSDPNMSLKWVKDQFNISFALITRLVKRHTGYGFLEYVSRIRIDHAKKLMLEEDMSSAKIREIVGFNDDSTFIKVFKKYEGITPGDYKGKIQK
jgi:YesN/AraC family two-component response regulator